MLDYKYIDHNYSQYWSHKCSFKCSYTCQGISAYCLAASFLTM